MGRLNELASAVDRQRNVKRLATPDLHFVHFAGNLQQSTYGQKTEAVLQATDNVAHVPLWIGDFGDSIDDHPRGT